MEVDGAYAVSPGRGLLPSPQGWFGIASPGCDPGHKHSGAAGTDGRGEGVLDVVKGTEDK